MLFRKIIEISSDSAILKEKHFTYTYKTAITRLDFDENQDLVGYFTLHKDLIQIQSDVLWFRLGYYQIS
jgi:hypothetical protein